MIDLAYHVVDVFTDRPYAGNPLAVVLDADDLPTAALQAMAREFNLSETAFPVRSDRADYRLRIFTPEEELPFAGHPSVGAGALLAALGRVVPGRVVMECGAGLLPLTVAADRAEVTAGTPAAGPPLDAAEYLAACGLAPADAVDGTARLCSTGLPWVFVEVAADAVGRVAPDPRALRVVCAGAERAAGVVVFAWDAATRGSHARVLGYDVPEDPATGSAAAAFGAWLAALGRVPGDGETAYVVRQGAEIGRPSLIEGAVVTRGGAAVECRVGGGVVRVASGSIAAP